jgi:hypothetical protein
VVTASLALAAVRIALAIMLDTAALVIWDIGTRSPVRLFTDIRAGLNDRRAIMRGLVRLAVGSIALLAAATVSAPVASRAADFTIIECWALVTALVLEQLLGPDLRARRR